MPGSGRLTGVFSPGIITEQTCIRLPAEAVRLQAVSADQEGPRQQQRGKVPENMCVTHFQTSFLYGVPILLYMIGARLQGPKCDESGKSNGDVGVTNLIRLASRAAFPYEGKVAARKADG